MRKSILVGILVIASTCGAAWSQDHEQSVSHTVTCIGCLSSRDTLTGNWFGLGEQLEEIGISVGLSLTQVYQISLQGSGSAATAPGVQTHRHSGRWTGKYDLEVEFNLDRLLSIPGVTFYTLTQGSWSNGLATSSIGIDGFGVNNTAVGDQSIALIEAWFQQSLFDGKLQVRAGKIDVTGGFEYRGGPGGFDGNAFANDDTAQFLNAALNNNPTVPFPAQGLGIVAYLEPVPGFYASIGVADSDAVASQTGFNTAFHGEDNFFAVFEAGVAPKIPTASGDLQGTYRVGFWYDPKPKDKLVGTKIKRDDMGFYLSFDQVVTKENTDEGDTQGAGVFFRYGFAHKDVNPIKCFFSVGGQYQGLIPSRDNDVLGLGLATGQLTDDHTAGIASSETAVEAYYNAEITPWATLSPSVQWITNPGGLSGVGDAWVLGLRLQTAF